jgi:hypothetical protein
VAADRAEQVVGPGLEIRVDARRAAFADGLADLLDPSPRTPPACGMVDGLRISIQARPAAARTALRSNRSEPSPAASTRSELRGLSPAPHAPRLKASKHVTST